MPAIVSEPMHPIVTLCKFLARVVVRDSITATDYFLGARTKRRIRALD